MSIAAQQVQRKGLLSASARKAGAHDTGATRRPVPIDTALSLLPNLRYLTLLPEQEWMDEWLRRMKMLDVEV